MAAPRAYRDVQPTAFGLVSIGRGYSLAAEA